MLSMILLTPQRDSRIDYTSRIFKHDSVIVSQTWILLLTVKHVFNQVQLIKNVENVNLVRQVIPFTATRDSVTGHRLEPVEMSSQRVIVHWVS